MFATAKDISHVVTDAASWLV
ncbi:hypothetical protein, partial [Acetobacterium bakii]